MTRDDVVKVLQRAAEGGWFAELYSTADRWSPLTTLKVKQRARELLPTLISDGLDLEVAFVGLGDGFVEATFKVIELESSVPTVGFRIPTKKEEGK